MKKIYSIICAIFFCGTILAQSANPQITKKDYSTISKSINSVVSSSIASTPATVIWSDDCSDINNWSLSNTSIPPLDWSIEMDPAAIPVSVLSPFASTTASNGYLFINSDATGGGDGDGTPVECTATTPMIDLTGWPYVQLTFSHNYRWWQDTRAVRVSGDGGNTWTQFDMTDANGYPNNQNTNNPQDEVINISSIAGDRDSVMVQFYYFDNDYWAWYWAVDDVAISEIPDNAMNITEPVQGGWWVNYLNTGGDGYDYSMKPLSQLTNNPYSFEAVLRNAGIAPQNSFLTAEVTDAGGSVLFNDVSNSLLLDVNYPQDTFAVNSTFSPTALGTYTVNMWGTGDSTSTPMVSLDMTVTENIYARDLNTPDGAWRVGRSCGGQVLGLKYDMYADETLYGLQVHINDQSIPNTPVFVVLYEDNPSGDPLYLTQSDDYYLTSADLGNWITIPFDGGYDLYSGTGYVAAIGGYANPVDTFLVSVSGESQGSCFIQDNGCDIGTGGFGYWYTTSETPMIRMSFDASVLDLNESALNRKINIHPNPTNGVLNIELDIVSEEFVLIVSDILGKEIYTKIVDGSSFEKIDLSEFDKGIYLLEISNSDFKFSEKIVLE